MIILRKNSNNFSLKIKNTYIPIETSLVPHLCDEMWIETDVLFEDFFNIILKHHEEYSSVFKSHLGGVNLSEFFVEWSKATDYEIKPPGMKRLLIKWANHEVIDENELYDEKRGLEISWLPEFYGTGTNEEGNDESYAIEFTPLNELKKYPLDLIPDYKVHNIETNKDIFYINRAFTVYEVLSAIFYEITFSGTPYERDMRLNELKERTERLKDEIDKAIPMEDVFDELLRKFNIDKPSGSEDND